VYIGGIIWKASLFVCRLDPCKVTKDLSVVAAAHHKFTGLLKPQFYSHFLAQGFQLSSHNTA
jgi:hypothetical protein